MNKIKILITDDHPFFRHGIKLLLSDSEMIGKIDEAGSGKSALEMLQKETYDLVIMDIKMPDLGGIEATQYIKRNFPSVKIIGMSMYDDKTYIAKMVRAGAKGYLLKSSGKDELLKAVEMVMKGEKYFSKEVSSALMNSIISDTFPGMSSFDDENVNLTKREREIIRMVAEEYTNVQIGENLGISPRTVDTHRRNLLQKLRVKNTAGLVKYALKNGILE